MRALFMAMPGIGHAFPMVPLAWALRAAGHDVAFATTSDALAVEKAGMPVLDIRPGTDLHELFKEFMAQDPEMFERMRNVKIRDFREIGAGAQFGTMFGRVLGELTGDFLHAATAWQPDLIITSPMLVAGFVAAAKLHVPVVAHGFGVSAAGHIVEVMREHAGESVAKYDVEFPAEVPSIDVVPTSLLADDSTGWRMQYVPYNGGGVTPEWLTEKTDRPRIGVTLGTVAPKMTGLGEVEQVIAAAPKIDAEFVLALGSTDLTELGELPPNVRAVGWVPLNALLRTCSGLIHHGGAGTALTAVASGVPQVIMPNGADRYINADAVSATGAALSVEDDELDVTVIERLLTDPKLRSAAETLRDEVREMPTPADLVSKVAGLL